MTFEQLKNLVQLFVSGNIGAEEFGPIFEEFQRLTHFDLDN